MLKRKPKTEQARRKREKMPAKVENRTANERLDEIASTVYGPPREESVRVDCQTVEHDTQMHGSGHLVCKRCRCLVVPREE